MLGLWEALVRLLGVPVYLLPGPVAIVAAFAADPVGLTAALLSTLAVTFVALAVAAMLGVLIALAMELSPLARAAIQPWAVVLQVTPIVAIAPLIVVLIGNPFIALVACATIVAFFPVFANTVAGLASPAPELAELFRLYGAGRWRTLRLLRLPSALPYFLAGFRISGGLALVGAVVAEFVAGSGDSRPAWPIVSWRRATGCRSRACSRRWYCSGSQGSRSIRCLAGSPLSCCAGMALHDILQANVAAPLMD